MIQNSISKAHSTSMTNLPTKFPKNIDKKDFLTSGTYDHKDMTYIYKISFEDMTGRRESVSSESLRSSVSDESMSTRYSMTEDNRSTVSPSALDNVHPILEDEELVNNFDEKSSKGILDDEEPDYDHLDSPIMLKSLQGFQNHSPDNSPFADDGSEHDYDHIAPIETMLKIKCPSQSFRDDQKQSRDSPLNKEPGSRAIRRRVVTGKRSDYIKSAGESSSGRTITTTLDPLVLNSTLCSSPDSGVQDDFAPSANSYNNNNGSIYSRRTRNSHQST